jgi:propionyl-CoA carboxylase alpha chain
VPGQVRVDTGVYEGGEISMFYDSMIAKLIVHGANREQAIERMRDALNAFVIRGISSNIPFQAALLQHPRFCSGNFNTGFIAEEYPQGFDASMVPHDDPALLAAIATFARLRYIDRAVQIDGQLAGHGRKVGADWVVVMGSKQYPVSVRRIDGGMAITHGDKTYHIVSEWRFGELLFTGTVNGAPVCLQIERRGLRYRISHFGLQVEPMVMTVRAAYLLSLMPEKLPPDMSRFLLSPMPGLLREIAVSAGQEVKVGEKLAVIEAMKMENVLKAEQDGKVKKIVATPGTSLAVDEVIVEFE